MSDSKADIGVLRGPLGVFSICALVSALVLGGSFYFRDAMHSEFRSFHGQFLDVSRKYQRLDEDEQVIAEFLPEFRSLYDDGIIGRERRLDWIESVQQAATTTDLPALSYRINTQRLFDPEAVPNPGAFDVYVSPMELELGLLHEGDLARFARAVTAESIGLGSFSNCVLRRKSVRADDLTPTTPRLDAHCRVDWLTIDLKGDAEVQL